MILYAVLLSVILWRGVGAASGGELAAQRAAFLAARQAYDAGELSRYQRLTSELKTYPLYPYLRYVYLRDHVQTVPERDLLQFIERYRDTPPGERLRNIWLFDLAGAKRWSEYLHLYRESGDPALQCYQLQARLNVAPPVGPDNAALLDQIEHLWRVGHRQPSACDAAFAYLGRSPRMTGKLIWTRIRLALEQGELQLAKQLALRLSNAEQGWVQRWASVYERPASQLNSPDFSEDLPIVRDIVAFAVRRLARSAAETAYTRWQQLLPRYHFSATQRAEVNRAIAVAAARQRSPHALQWLADIAEDDTDATVRDWRIRIAAMAGDWGALERWTRTLPATEQTEASRYWRARALDQRGQIEAALALYRALASQHSYYGFLASDRLQQAYTLSSQPTPADATVLNKLAGRAGFRRAGEFYQLRLIPEARREWSYATRTLSAPELAQAAVLARQWGWYERAIITAAKGGQWDDLELRFPTPFRAEVMDNARRQQIDSAWIYGVMRQESAFMVDARSSVGALGLMQLMPATAAHTAHLLALPARNGQQLLKPASNIELGSAYLRQILNRFRGNQMLATAAYNAGPARVRQWLPGKRVAADQWVETIPFAETRKYVQSVLSYSVIFDWRLKQPMKSLQRRMGKAVPTRTDLAAP